MGYNANFQPDTILYADELNAAFANVVNIAGDTITGTLFLQGAGTGLNVLTNATVGSLVSNTTLVIAGIDIGSGLTQAQTNANSSVNLSQSAFNKANAGTGLQTTTYLIDPTKPGLTVNNGVIVALTGNNTLILGSNVASTSAVGVVQLNDTVTSISVNQAATANAINTVWTTAMAAFAKANNAGVGGNNSSNIGIGSITFQANTLTPGLTVNTGVSVTITGNNTIIIGANAASITNPGVVQLNDTVTSSSLVLAPTAHAVNTVYNLASLAVSRAGDTMTGKLSANGSGIGLEVANNAVIDGTLTVKGQSSVIGTLTITGPSTLTSVNAATMNVASTLNVAGPLITQSINIIGDVTVTGNINAGTTATKLVPLGGTYDLTTNDSGVTLLFNNSSQTLVNAGSLPVGFRVILTQINTGNVIIRSVGSASVHPRVGANNKITGQWASASLFCYQTNNLILDGSIS